LNTNFPFRKITFFTLASLALSLIATACGGASDDTLPTVANLDAIASATAEYATLNPPTATNTPIRSTLPPTFTPTPSQTPTQTPVPTSTSASSMGAEGAIYYLYNGDSIAVATTDGLTRDIFITVGIGVPIGELTLSPDGQYLAYVAPGNGRANEIYISNLDATYNQRITCLGFEHIKDVIWKPDSASLTFMASPMLGEALNIYQADVAGSIDCPTGNNQRLLVPLGLPDARGLAWNLTGDLLFYGFRAPLFVYDTTADTSVRYTFDTGVGPDFSPVHSPTDDRLAYLASLRDSQGQLGGALAFIEDTTFVPESPRPARAEPYSATSLSWRADGQALLMTTTTRVVIIGMNGTIRDVSEQALSSPEAVFSPDGRYIAYTAPDPETQVEQIYIYDTVTQESDALTDNPSGTITNLVWAEVDL
jgi:Tol biopolymer transport system component